MPDRSPVTLREGTADDVPAVADLHARARAAYYAAGGAETDDLDDPAAVARRRARWAESMARPGSALLCAEDAHGRLVGLLAWGPPHDDDLDPATGRQLFQVHVDPDAWGCGTGSLLHRAFTDRLAADGYVYAVLEVWAANHRARRFYADRGWRPDGVRRPGPAGEDYLRLRLDP